MKITIENIKHIKKLEFQLEEKNSVYALTGKNGSGKTTLLAAIARMKNKYAFRNYFQTSYDTHLDRFAGKITYEINNDEVYYKYAGKNWSAHPRKKSSLFTQIKFSDIKLIPPNEKRLFIHKKELKINTISDASPEFKAYMNKIFGTSKFDNLRQMNVERKQGKPNRKNIAYLIEKAKNSYYTEKNFSLGEMIVLNLFLELQNIPQKALILIDEIELALHPKVQVNLINYFKEYSKENDTQIILSTHSSNVIRHVDSIIFLKTTTNGETQVHYDAYPAQAIGQIADTDDFTPDIIFLVEDKMANILLVEMIKEYGKYVEKLPDYKVVPIGGYNNVLSFHKENQNYLFNGSTMVSFLDADVKETIEYLKDKRSNTALYDELVRSIEFLPITPELGLMEFINENKEHVEEILQEKLSSHNINVANLLESIEYETLMTNPNNKNIEENNASMRKASKKLLDKFIEGLRGFTHNNEESLEKLLFVIYVEKYYADENNKNNLRRIFGTFFSEIKR